MKCLVGLPVSMLAALVLFVAPVAGQSLADVAKKEEVRRSAVRAPSKTYTNADLMADPTRPQTDSESATAAAPPSAGVATAPVAASASPDGQAPAVASAAPVEEKLDEKFWRSRAADLRVRVQKAQQQIETLSASQHKDPREQARLERLRKTAQGVLERAEEVQRLFLTEAEAAKVPKDWIQ